MVVGRRWGRGDDGKKEGKGAGKKSWGNGNKCHKGSAPKPKEKVREQGWEDKPLLGRGETSNIKTPGRKTGPPGGGTRVGSRRRNAPLMGEKKKRRKKKTEEEGNPEKKKLKQNS